MKASLLARLVLVSAALTAIVMFIASKFQTGATLVAAGIMLGIIGATYLLIGALGLLDE